MKVSGKLEIILEDGNVKVISPDESVKVHDGKSTFGITTSVVTYNKIPSNYGLITWNGAYLTVS